MSTLTKIAAKIAERGAVFGWKPGTKAADKLNIEAWAGAFCALDAVGHPDAGHVGTYIAMVISTRGYRETLALAAKHEDGDNAPQS